MNKYKLQSILIINVYSLLGICLYNNIKYHNNYTDIFLYKYSLKPNLYLSLKSITNHFN